MHDPAFMEWLTDPSGAGLILAKEISRNRWAEVGAHVFDFTIKAGRMGDREGYDDCWWYRELTSARDALADWDGSGEPKGWLRAKHADPGCNHSGFRW